MKKQIHTIDATGKSLGRLASRIAIILQGKHRADFKPNTPGQDFIVVENIKKMKITGKKMEQKKYYRHSGYLGGLKETPLSKLFEKDPAQVLRKAVWGMLPKNKLRSKMIKRLTIKQ